VLAAIQLEQAYVISNALLPSYLPLPFIRRATETDVKRFSSTTYKKEQAWSTSPYL
jgi:hypothetical protein